MKWTKDADGVERCGKWSLTLTLTRKTKKKACYTLSHETMTLPPSLIEHPDWNVGRSGKVVAEAIGDREDLTHEEMEAMVREYVNPGIVQKVNADLERLVRDRAAKS